MQQSSTVLNFRASRQRTPAIQPVMYRCHELSLQRIELAITSVSSLLGNQLVAPESQRARDHGQRAVVTSRVELSFSFLYPFSIHLWRDRFASSGRGISSAGSRIISLETINQTETGGRRLTVFTFLRLQLTLYKRLTGL